LKTELTTSRTNGTHGVLAVVHSVVWWFGVVALFTACTTERLPPRTGGAPVEVALAELNPGAIMIVSSPQPAEIGCDPPNDKMEYASEGAGMAVRSVLDTPRLGHAQLEAVVGVLEIPLAPFAAAYGAIKAGQERIPPDKLSQVELDLREAMRASAGSAALREKVADAARQRTSRLLVSAASASAAPASQSPVSAVLELAVEQLRLEVVKVGKSEYTLRIAARARLLRRSDGAVLVDRPYQYKSGPALFIDWARHGGLDSVAQTAYQSLAERIAEDIFKPASERPLLIGPGQQHSAVSSLSLTRSAARQAPRDLWWEESDPSVGEPALVEPHLRRASLLGDNWQSVRLQQADEDSSAESPAFQFVSLVEDNVTALDVYAGKADQRLPLDAPGLGSGEGAGVQNDTEWAMDGLVNDRNAVVQLVSCLAAVPMGIWEQTVGAVLNTSRNKTEKLAQALDTVPEQKHFEGDLADEVARRLRAQVINQVRRTEEPLRFAVATPGDAGGTGSAQPPSSKDSKIALQIQVVNARLIGKRGSSRLRALCVETRATIIRTSDGQELYSRPIRYRSSSKKLKDWAASDGLLFRQELGACSRQTAEALTDDLIRHGFVTQGLGSSVPTPASSF
jgi:hypothetical protein